MSMTPGPWRVSDSGISILCGIPDPDAGFPNGVPLAHVCNFGSFENRCADARLIAAAPDLLAACEMLDSLDCCDGYTFPKDDWQKLWEALNLARAAIAKAKGE